MTRSDDWRDQPTTIAIRNRDSERWEYQTFESWNEARQALNRAREQGKVAIVYDGGSPNVPEFMYPDITETEDE